MRVAHTSHLKLTAHAARRAGPVGSGRVSTVRHVSSSRPPGGAMGGRSPVPCAARRAAARCTGWRWRGVAPRHRQRRQSRRPYDVLHIRIQYIPVELPANQEDTETWDKVNDIPFPRTAQRRRHTDRPQRRSAPAERDSIRFSLAYLRRSHQPAARCATAAAVMAASMEPAQPRRQREVNAFRSERRTS